MNAPIALFVYKRLWHTQQTVASLQANDLAADSDLFIYSDGPKENDPLLQKNVQAVREWLRTIKGFKSITIIERNANFGLAKSIITGVTDLINQFGKIIVIEDDLLLAKGFLTYMNDGLNLYEGEEHVASIHGYALSADKENLPPTFFLPGADCWGWATWKRAWDKFEENGEKLLKLLKQNKLCYEFNYNGSQANIRMLQDQINGKNNSWAIRWHASACVNHMMSLHPRQSLVRNIGLDNSGEHCALTAGMDVELSQYFSRLVPIPIQKNELALKAYANYYKSTRPSFFRKLHHKLQKLWVNVREAKC